MASRNQSGILESGSWELGNNPLPFGRFSSSSCPASLNARRDTALLLSVFPVASSYPSLTDCHRLYQRAAAADRNKLLPIIRHVHHISKSHVCIQERASRLLQRLRKLSVVDVAVVVLVVVSQDAIYDADELLLAHGWGLLTPLFLVHVSDGCREL